MYYLKCALSLLLVYSICCLAKPAVEIPPKNPNDPARLPSGIKKSVLIIGGGLAGLSAALELVDRGYSVTIKEKESYIGGKLFTLPVNVFSNKTFWVEHGFHAWFHNYYQFKDIRTRLGINGNFKRWDKVHFIFKNYKPEVIYSVGPYPLNLIGIIERSPNLHLTDAILSTLSLPDMIFYDYDKIFDKYDNITFQQWAHQTKVAKDFYDIIMAPALSITLNDRDIYSAAEMLTLMQIYFLTNAQADEREVVTGNFYQSVVKPWTDYLSKFDVRFIFNSEVASLKIGDQMNVYGTVDKSGDDKIVYDHVIMASDVGSTQYIINQTMSNYAKDEKISAILSNINKNFIGPMKVAPDYRVIRVWFDKKLNENAPDILETPDFSPINLVVQYSLIEDEYINWSLLTGGSVIEFHCYTWSKTFDPSVPDSEVWRLISPTVKLIYPEIFDRQFNVLAYHVNNFKNFASFEKGLFHSRPYTDTLAQNGLNNLYLAGDWIKTKFPAALMEKAVSTGRLAANEVLIRDRVRQASLLVINNKGPGPI